MHAERSGWVAELRLVSRQQWSTRMLTQSTQGHADGHLPQVPQPAAKTSLKTSSSMKPTIKTSNTNTVMRIVDHNTSSYVSMDSAPTAAMAAEDIHTRHEPRAQIQPQTPGTRSGYVQLRPDTQAMAAASASAVALAAAAGMPGTPSPARHRHRRNSLANGATTPGERTSSVSVGGSAGKTNGAIAYSSRIYVSPGPVGRIQSKTPGGTPHAGAHTAKTPSSKTKIGSRMTYTALTPTGHSSVKSVTPLKNPFVNDAAFSGNGAPPPMMHVRSKSQSEMSDADEKIDSRTGHTAGNNESSGSKHGQDGKKSLDQGSTGNNKDSGPDSSKPPNNQGSKNSPPRQPPSVGNNIPLATVSRTYQLDPIVRVVNDARVTHYFYGGVTNKQIDNAWGVIDQDALEAEVKADILTGASKNQAAISQTSTPQTPSKSSQIGKPQESTTPGSVTSITKTTVDPLSFPGKLPEHRKVEPIIRASKILEEITYEGAHFYKDAPFKSRDTLKLFLLPHLTDADIGSLIPVIIPAHHLLAHRNLAVKARALWGTEIYTDDSDLVAILIHTGNFDPFPPSQANGSRSTTAAEPNGMNGNSLTQEANSASFGDLLSPPTIHCLVRVLPKLTKYTGSLKYGLQSRGWGGSHDGLSIRIEKVWCESSDPVVASTWLRPNWYQQYFDYLLHVRLDRIACWKDKKVAAYLEANPPLESTTQTEEDKKADETTTIESEPTKKRPLADATADTEVLTKKA